MEWSILQTSRASLYQDTVDKTTLNVCKVLDYKDAKNVNIPKREIDMYYYLDTATSTAVPSTHRNAPDSGSLKRRSQSRAHSVCALKRVKLPGEPEKIQRSGRVHKRLVNYTLGKVKELLEAFRDTIKCHQSLFEDSKILHQDVSINNMLISVEKDGPRGFLIDLDHAKELDSDPSDMLCRTGTMEFMAIEILWGSQCHTWCHDLESFLYVMIWTFIMYQNG